MQALFRMAKTETCACQFSEICQWNELPKVARVAKSLPASAGDTRDAGLIPGLGRSPGEGSGNPLQYFLPGKFHGQKSLVGYSPWSNEESDTSERAHTHNNINGIQ